MALEGGRGDYNGTMRYFITIATLLLLTGCCCRVITARHYEVLHVIDGDTLRIMYDGEPTSIRLPHVNFTFTPDFYFGEDRH